jgi:hypothetical protein
LGKLLGDCLLWAVLLKVKEEAQILGSDFGATFFQV